MSDPIVYEQLDEQPVSADDAGAAAPGIEAAGADPDLRRLSDVPLELSVEIGSTRMTVGETLGLRPGSIVTLERLAGEPVDLLVNGTPIARGEVVVVDEQFGLRVSEIVEGDAAQTLAEEHGRETQQTAMQAAGGQAAAADLAAAAGQQGAVAQAAVADRTAAAGQTAAVGVAGEPGQATVEAAVANLQTAGAETR